MKKLIILSLIFGTIFMTGCSCSVKDKDNDNVDSNDNSTVITDEDVLGEQNVDGILFENTTFQVKDGVTTIVTKVTNNTGAEYQLNNYQMVITDKNGSILTILTSEVTDTLAIDDTKTYTTTFTLDLTDAAKVDYNVNIEIPKAE